MFANRKSFLLPLGLVTLGLAISSSALASKTANANENAVCAPPAPETELSSLINFMREITDSNKSNSNCRNELGNNEHRIQKASYWKPEHLLRRDSQGNYQAFLNLEFNPLAGAKVGHQEMFERVNECLVSVAPFMRGPEGNNLQIQLLTPEEVQSLPRKQRPASHSIDISPAPHRSTSANYEEDISCSVIVHEVLHLFGLVDEYHEKSEELGPKYSCRPQTNDSSIMFDHIQAFEESVPVTSSCDCSSPPCVDIIKLGTQLQKRLYLENKIDEIPYAYPTNYCEIDHYLILNDPPTKPFNVIAQTDLNFTFEVESAYEVNDTTGEIKYTNYRLSCQCPAGDQDCLKEKARILDPSAPPAVRNECPPGAGPIETANGGPAGRVFITDYVLKLTTNIRRGSLLHPNHFKRAIAGGCAENVPDYNRCAEYAYEGGDSCDTPEECSDIDNYLGVIED